MIAILRGCLLVPIFEEIFFRGLLLSWLNWHVRFVPALLVHSALFAAMHVFPVVFPYAFLAGIATGYVRRATGSTFNTVLIHVINNVVLSSSACICSATEITLRICTAKPSRRAPIAKGLTELR